MFFPPRQEIPGKVIDLLCNISVDIVTLIHIHECFSRLREKFHCSDIIFDLLTSLVFLGDVLSHALVFTDNPESSKRARNVQKFHLT